MRRRRTAHGRVQAIRNTRGEIHKLQRKIAKLYVFICIKSTHFAGAKGVLVLNAEKSHADARYSLAAAPKSVPGRGASGVEW